MRTHTLTLINSLAHTPTPTHLSLARLLQHWVMAVQHGAVWRPGRACVGQSSDQENGSTWLWIHSHPTLRDRATEVWILRKNRDVVSVQESDTDVTVVLILWNTRGGQGRRACLASRVLVFVPPRGMSMSSQCQHGRSKHDNGSRG